MILGTLRTPNYEWQTLANTTAEALANLKSVWDSHAEDVVDPYPWEWIEECITLTPLRVGDTLGNCTQCENLAHGEVE